MKAFHLNVDQGREEVLSALQENRESHFVCVETKQQFLPRNQLLRVFEGLSRFHEMRQCFLKKLRSLPAESLVTLLSRQQHLDFLYLQNVTLQADAEGMRRLAEAFRSHRGLRKIRFWMLRPATGTNISLDAIISAISYIPTLEEVTFIHCKMVSSDDAQQQQQDWHGGSLRDLCRSKSLKVLTLTFTTSLKDEHIELMAESLQSNSILRSLSVRGSLGRAAGVSIANLLRGNSKLEQLRLQLQHDDHAMPIVEALHHNTNLKRLGLVLPRKAENSNSRKRFTSKAVEMLRNGNYHLLNMDMGGGLWTYDQDEIRFYLKANQVGRNRLLAEGATGDEWMEALIANKDDISLFFYFLVRAPSLALNILSKLMTMESSSAVVVTPDSRDSRKRSRDEAGLPDSKPTAGTAEHKRFKAN